MSVNTHYIKGETKPSKFQCNVLETYLKTFIVKSHTYTRLNPVTIAEGWFYRFALSMRRRDNADNRQTTRRSRVAQHGAQSE